MHVPHFGSTSVFSLRDEARNVADRAALRQSSEIFTGYARDLALGLPLLRYFGGVDDSYVPPPDNTEEYERLLRLVDQALEAYK